jgi:DNA polymerase III alpha subunit
MYNVLPLFKSHFSLGKSILTLEKPSKTGLVYPVSVFDLLKQQKLDTLVLVDDNVSGLLQASGVAKENGIKLFAGVRLWITDHAEQKDESVLKKQAKYIIFVKSPSGYKKLVKIWSYASKEGFYYEPRLDFKTLKNLWGDDLILAVPFYDSFLYLNSFEGYNHVPQYDFTKPVFLTEDNSLPYDNYLQKKVTDFAANAGASVLPAQSIFYKTPDDFIAYLALRCLHNRTTIEKPELNHMGSDEFNFVKWLKINNEKV